MSEYVEVDCDICSCCKDHAGFTRNEDGEALSECCEAPAHSVDYEPHDYETEGV